MATTKTTTQPIPLPTDDSLFPVRWLHMDDDTECDRHQVCTRPTYVRGGRANFGSGDE
jgi:hypothetical protein